MIKVLGEKGNIRTLKRAKISLNLSTYRVFLRLPLFVAPRLISIILSVIHKPCNKVGQLCKFQVAMECRFAPLSDSVCLESSELF